MMTAETDREIRMENSLNEFFDARDEHSVATATASVENSYTTAPRTEDRSVTVASVTAAEPIEDDQDDNSYYGKHIPTIRLSSLGCAMEKDVGAVQNEFGSDDDDDGSTENQFSDEFTNNSAEGDYPLQKQKAISKGQDLSESNPVTPSASSEEITVEDHQNQPQRQRLVSEEGVIAEYDVNGDSGRQNDSDVDEVMAEAVEIDSSFHDVSFRSEMEDLEMGDAEPLPYPGRRGQVAPNISRNTSANQSSSASRRSSAGMYARAELLSGTVIKNSPTEQIGINLMRDDTVVYSINRGEEDEGNCLLRHCPFQAGDRVLSINNKRTNHMDSSEAARLLREASGFVTIVCHNHGGDPCLIETMITKANKNQRSGMGLKSTGSRDLRVSSINENGLFAQSLLNVGDRILTINEVDVTEVDARVACDIIKNAPDRVTVLARQSHTTAVVVAEVSNRGLRTDQTDLPLETVHESGADPNEIEAVDDTFHFTKRQREQLMIAFALALLLIGILSGVLGRPEG